MGSLDVRGLSEDAEEYGGPLCIARRVGEARWARLVLHPMAPMGEGGGEGNHAELGGCG